MKYLLILSCLLFTSVGWSEDVEYNSGLKEYQAGNYIKAIDIWKPLAEKGNAEAQYGLATLYFYSEDYRIPSSENIKLGMKWLKKSAEQKYVDAMGMLAGFYERGFQVNKNIQKAMEIRKEAAGTGDGLAIYNLAISYLQGNEIINSDIEKAILLLKQAAKKGIPTASFNLGVTYLKNQKYYNMREAYKWFLITSKWEPNSSVQKMSDQEYSRIIGQSKDILILLEKELGPDIVKEIVKSN